MIYAIQAGEWGPIKFGTAEAPRKRLNELQTGSAEKLILQAFADIHQQNERMIHHFLREDRLEGEWFKPTDKVWKMVEVIRRQAMFPGHHVVSGYIYELGYDSIVWSRGQIGLPKELPGDFDRRHELEDMQEELTERQKVSSGT